MESSDSDQEEPTPFPRSTPQPLPRSCRLFSFFCPITPDKRREVLLPCFHHCTQDGGLSTMLWAPGIPGQVERASVGRVLGCLAPRPVLPSANTPLRAQCTASLMLSLDSRNTACRASVTRCCVGRVAPANYVATSRPCKFLLRLKSLLLFTLALLEASEKKRPSAAPGDSALPAV